MVGQRNQMMALKCNLTPFLPNGCPLFLDPFSLLFFCGLDHPDSAALHPGWLAIGGQTIHEAPLHVRHIPTGVGKGTILGPPKAFDGLF